MPKNHKVINLALQGGGAHGAFTWGALERLLEDDRLAFEGITGTSSGAMNAVALAYGLTVDGREGAQRTLASLWERSASMSRVTRCPPCPTNRNAG